MGLLSLRALPSACSLRPTGSVSYYRLMLLHPPLARYVTEWQPPAVQGATIVFFVSALAAAALWGARRRSLTSFEQWALVLLLVAALAGVRNGVWFELAAAVSLPRLLDALRPPRLDLSPAARRANTVLAAGAIAAVAVRARDPTRPRHRLARRQPFARGRGRRREGGRQRRDRPRRRPSMQIGCSGSSPVSPGGSPTTFASSSSTAVSCSS